MSLRYFAQFIAVVCAVWLVTGPGYSQDAVGSKLRRESFDRNPQWEAHDNRIVPAKVPTVVQDFGYSESKHAGRSPGEMGGWITRASIPALYAAKIGPLTLNDRLSASGSFAVTKTIPGGGLFFGFFRAAQPGGGGRPICSLGMNIDCEHSGGRIAVRLITGKNFSCGTFATPYVPGKFRPTPIRNDGTRYLWTLDYDPAAADGHGRFTFTLTSDTHRTEDYGPLNDVAKAEAAIRFPQTTTFSVDLTEGFKDQDTVFDRFGMMNMMKAGGGLSIFFDDLNFNGRDEDFSQDPTWHASGNRAKYQATDVQAAHNFGFSPTNHAGGRPGEIGGVF